MGYLLVGPEFKGAVVGGGRYVLGVRGDVHAHDLAVVSLEGLERLPRFVGPDLNGMMIFD